MEFKITEEMVEEIISQKVEEAVSEAAIERLVREAVDYEIRKKIERKIEERADAIASEVADDLLSQKVDIDDGWGHRERFDTFADYYRSKLKESMSDRMINDVIKKAVNERVNREVAEKRERIKELVASEIESGDAGARPTWSTRGRSAHRIGSGRAARIPAASSKGRAFTRQKRRLPKPGTPAGSARASASNADIASSRRTPSRNTARRSASGPRTSPEGLGTRGKHRFGLRRCAARRWWSDERSRDVLLAHVLGRKGQVGRQHPVRP